MNIYTNNIEFQDALSLIQYTSQSVFLTGKAGTGKSTFLKYICENTRKKHIVLAPTGVAAINAGGSTIHSFFKMPFRPILPDDPDLSLTNGRIFNFLKYRKAHRKLLKEVELIIIDEISMVRADMIDFIDRVLRVFSGNMRLPFGGKQLLFVGDIYQLEPVVTSDAKEILEWLCRPFLFACMQKRNKESIRILPLAAVKLAKLEFIEGNIKQAWNILEQTKRLMKREQNNGAIWLILNCQKHFISASRNTQFSVQEKILNEYKKYDLIVSSSAINPYAIWESSTDNHIWISNDVIRNARLQKGLTQHQACEGIIEPETYSRFESGKSRLRWEKQKLLLERLGQSSARVQFIVDSPHPKVLVTAKNILTDIQLGRLNMANEKYIELSCWLTESSVNDKFNQLVTGQLDSMF